MITYRIDLSQTHSHEFLVSMTVPNPTPQQLLSLPVWIPGSYMVREFARHISQLEARQGRKRVALTQLDKARWQADCSARGTLEVSYRVYAFDASVRTAFLDAQRGFFNGTSLFLRAEGLEDLPHRVELKNLPAGWQVATALTAAVAPQADARGGAGYVAADYDELVDQPFELGRFWRGQFEVHGVPHEVVVSGALPDFDGERLLADTRRICEAEMAFWHADSVPPFQRYVFLLNAMDDAYGGLEHRASTALIAARRDLPRLGTPDGTELSDGYVTLLGLISHEYFHTWNVKRMRPAEFSRFDYSRENYTELLWFFEGFTSYYDDLFLLRAGLIDEARYLKLVAKTISSVLAAPGRKVQSVAQSSFDAWVKYYRQDENSPNAIVSYYAKGSLVALALDLTLRSEPSRPRKTASLDAVMRALWTRSQGGPISEADIAFVLADVAGRSMSAELQAWVHGTDDLPLQALFDRFGVHWHAQCATLAQQLGLKVQESALTGVKLSQVLRGSAAQAAGLSPGDELLAVDGWRIRRFDDAQRLLTPGGKSTVLVSRDQRVLSLPLSLPAKDKEPLGTVMLSAAGRGPRTALARRNAWFAG